jgi:hypothetical protein
MMVVFDQPNSDGPEAISLKELAAAKPPKAVVAVAPKAPAPRKSARNWRRDRLRRLKRALAKKPRKATNRNGRR